MPYREDDRARLVRTYREDDRARLVRIEHTVERLTRIATVTMEASLMAQSDINHLKDVVSRLVAVVDRAKTDFAVLAQQVRDALDDPAELKALADQIDTKVDELSTAADGAVPQVPTV